MTTAAGLASAKVGAAAKYGKEVGHFFVSYLAQWRFSGRKGSVWQPDTELAFCVSALCNFARNGGKEGKDGDVTKRKGVELRFAAAASLLETALHLTKTNAPPNLIKFESQQPHIVVVSTCGRSALLSKFMGGEDS